MSRSALVHSYGTIPAPEIRLETAHAKMERFLDREGLDCVLVTAQDAFLSEYTVLANNQRHALSRFTGSTGDGIFLSRAWADALGLAGQFVLFVDGRYHLQADQECPSAFVTVVKLSISESIETAMLQWLSGKRFLRGHLGFDGARTSWKRFQLLTTLASDHGISVKPFLGNEISAAIGLDGWTTRRPVTALPTRATGRSIARNIGALHAILPQGTPPDRACLLTCASDDAAWLLNARGFHMPQQSSVLAYTALIGRKIVLYLPQGSDASPVELPLQGTDDGGYEIQVVRGEIAHFENALADHAGVTDIVFSDKVMNALVPTIARKAWPTAKLHGAFEGVETLRARKTPEELSSIREAFLKSSRAIAETMRWVKSATVLTPGTPTRDSAFTAPVSEADLAEKIAAEYARQGALELSFRTIAANGEHGAIIHYSTPDARTPLRGGDLVLLDSGAYYVEGFATDCTRVVYAPASDSARPAPWQTEIYTLTLKACVAGMTAAIAEATPCRDVDAAVRAHVKEKGYDYNHGTGHGVGIHVHESGIRLSPTSAYGFTEHAVSSIEPGIYLEGKGGVRLENVAAVARHPAVPGAFCFENFVYVGFDWDLIDLALLTDAEKEYLKSYEAECARLGTQVTACPL